MHWVSQIQSIRNELERIRTALKESGSPPPQETERKRLLEETARLNMALDHTESLLLASLNNGTTYWAGHSQTYDTPKTELCGNNLFDRIKNIYNTFIELQRDVIRYLSGQVGRYDIKQDMPAAIH
jgi:hypothetical protein